MNPRQRWTKVDFFQQLFLLVIWLRCTHFTGRPVYHLVKVPSNLRLNHFANRISCRVLMKKESSCKSSLLYIKTFPILEYITEQNKKIPHLN